MNAIDHQSPAGAPAKHRPALVSVHGEPIEVSDVRDINEPLSPEHFWSLVPEAPLDPPTTTIWAEPVLRNYFLGPYQDCTGELATTAFSFDQPARLAARDRELPVRAGLLGETVDPAMPLTVASDIAFRPLMRGHAEYSNRYYPRRMQDFILADYLPAYLLTGDAAFRDRALELLGFLDHAQWRADGSNRFTAAHFPDTYEPHPEWRGGWDYLFDFEWLDGYGYTWQLHEPDHHVCAQHAHAALRSYEVLEADPRYLEMAREFVYHQVPRYGFHTGIWRGQRYYWTEYNPTGQAAGHPVTDATDNIAALVGSAVAVLGYHEQDPGARARYLEYARGLLWYLAREFTADGRFYYDGAENPMNPRAARSHDSAVLLPAFVALAYLYKSGVDVADLLEVFGDVDEAYLQNWPPAQGFSQLRMYKVYDGSPQAGQPVTFTSFVQVTTADVAQARFHDALPDGFEAAGTLQVRISELLPPNGTRPDWTANADHDVTVQVSPDQLSAGVAIPFPLRRGEVYAVTYAAVAAPEFDRTTAADTDSAVTGWSGTDAGATYVRATSGNGVRWPHAFTKPLAHEIAIDSGNLLSFAAALHFPFDEERNTRYRPAPPPAARPYTEPRNGVHGQAGRAVYPISALIPPRASSGCRLSADHYATQGVRYAADGPGDFVEVEFPVEAGQEAGYDVALAFNTGNDRGQVAIWLDGERQGGDVDLYRDVALPHLSYPGTLDVPLGTRRLGAGVHTLRVVVTGRHPASSGFDVGLRELTLLPQSP